MTTSAANPFRLTERCPVCLRPVGPKHRETCSGPAQRIADPKPEPASCECVGAWHQPDCYLVVEGEPAA